MSSLSYMRLFIDDYEAATAHLSLEEDGAYLRLLRICWRMPRGTIPNDPDWIRRKMRVDQKTYDRVVAPIIEEFFKRRKGRLYQARLMAEFAFANELSNVRTASGKRGGDASALKRRQTRSSKRTDLLPANAEQNPSTHTHNNKPPYPLSKKPKTNGAGEPSLETVAWRVKGGITPYPPPDLIRQAIAAGLLTEDEARERGVL